MGTLREDQRPVRLVAIDMDGTLLGADGTVSSRTLAALKAAEAAGMHVVIATGRRHCYAMRQLRALGLDDAQILVSSNGAVVRRIDATLVDRTFLNSAAALRLCGHLSDLRNALVITFDCVGPDGEDARGALVVEELAELHISIGRWIAANEPYIQHVKPIEQALRDRDPIQMMLCGTVERMRSAERRLLEIPGIAAPESSATDRLPGAEADRCIITLHRTEYPERDLSILDILPAGCSKGAALLALAKTWGIDPSEIMAIGDNWNDLSMLEIAGHPVLMGNAPAELQQMAIEQGWHITASHLDDGVALAVETALAVELAHTASHR